MSEKHGSNGFLFGLIVGGAVGALVSTKKGRQILKDVVDYGVEYVGNTINADDIESILNGEEEDMSSYTEASEDKMKEEKPVSKSDEDTHEEPKKRKFFRGIRK